MRVRTIERVEEFEALESAWDQLAIRAGVPPFLLSAYVAEQWRSRGSAAQCLLAEADDGRLLAGLPLIVQRRLVLRTGTLLAGSHRGELLCDPDAPDEVAMALLDAAPVDWIPVSGVRPDSRLARVVSLRPQHEQNLRLEMPDGFRAAYEALTAAKSRSEDRRKLRRLRQEGEIDFEVATSGEALQRGLTEAFGIYRRRWEGRREEAGGFATEEQSWRAAAAAMGERGRVQLVVMWVDGVGVAFMYAFRVGETLWGHRAAFDPAYDRHSVGWLTVLRAIEVASDAGARVVDFGLGSEAYKVRLATSTVELLHGGRAGGARGQAAARADAARLLARRRAKTLRR